MISIRYDMYNSSEVGSPVWCGGGLGFLSTRSPPVNKQIMRHEFYNHFLPVGGSGTRHASVGTVSTCTQWSSTQVAFRMVKTTFFIKLFLNTSMQVIKVGTASTILKCQFCQNKIPEPIIRPKYLNPSRSSNIDAILFAGISSKFEGN